MYNKRQNIMALTAAQNTSHQRFMQQQANNTSHFPVTCCSCTLLRINQDLQNHHHFGCISQQQNQTTIASNNEPLYFKSLIVQKLTIIAISIFIIYIFLLLIIVIFCLYLCIFQYRLSIFVRCCFYKLILIYMFSLNKLFAIFHT